MKFVEYPYYDVELGTRAVRVSVADEQGREFFAVVPRLGGKAYRELRGRALERMRWAMLMGDDPGEVFYEEADSVQG